MLKQFAEALMFGNAQAWRLQSLTDLDTLPDYEEGWGYYGGQPQGAPVDADGNPIFYALPKSWDAAKNDGERWRWVLETMVEWNPALRNEERMHSRPVSANRNSACRRWPSSAICAAGRPTADTDEADDKTGTWALDTLGEDETIARLATGIKRFKLPDEHNYIKLYQQVVEDTPAKQAGHLRCLAHPRAWRRSSRIAGNIRGRPNIGGWRSSATPSDARNAVPAAARSDRRQLGPVRSGDVAAGRPRGDGRFPLPQRQAGRVRRPRNQHPQAARRRESLS